MLIIRPGCPVSVIILVPISNFGAITMVSELGFFVFSPQERAFHKIHTINIISFSIHSFIHSFIHFISISIIVRENYWLTILSTVLKYCGWLVAVVNRSGISKPKVI